MFQPNIYPVDDKAFLQLVYDGNPESVGQKLYFRPDTGQFVTSYDVRGQEVLCDTGIRFEDITQDFTLAGQGFQKLQSMYQFATRDTAEIVCSIIQSLGLPYEVTTEIVIGDKNVAFPTSKPKLDIVVTRPENGKSIKLNAGLEAQAFAATLICQSPTTCEYKPAPKLEMLKAHISAGLQDS